MRKVAIFAFLIVFYSKIIPEKISPHSEGQASLNLSASAACPSAFSATVRYSVMQFSSMSLLAMVYSTMVSLEALDKRLPAILSCFDKLSALD